MFVRSLTCRARVRAAVVLSVVCLAFAPYAWAADIAVLDPALDAVLRAALGDPAGPLQDTDLASISTLNANEAGIRDLTGIEFCSALSTLSLKGNVIRSVAPLGSLPELATVNLENNQICDLSPLAGNLNLNGTDLLYVAGNPLSVNSCAISISTMVGRGVTVESGSACDGGGVAACPVAANIPDPALDTVLRNVLGSPSGPLYTDELASLTGYLFATSTGIVDLTGIEHCTGLTILELGNNPLGNLAPLAGLTNVEELHLEYTGVTDLSPLAGMTGLKVLYVGNNELSSLAPLASLSQLTLLDANNNQISDLSGLAGLTSLNALNVSNNQIADLSPLTGLSNLKSLLLGFNEIVDLAPLAGLTTLEQLSLSNNQVADLSSLSALSNLKSLTINDNQLTDLGTLPTLPSLTSITLDGNPLTSLTGLDTQPVLENLNASECQYSDISPLSEIPSLLYAYINGNPIIDLSPLAELDNLIELDFRDTQVTDLSPLADLAALSYLDFGSNQVSDLSPLAGVSTLEELYFDDNQVSDLSPLAGLTALRFLYFNGNNVCDLSPLLLNTGVGAGDDLEAAGNPLTVEGCESVADLDALGVDIAVDTACDGGGLAFCEATCEDPSANLVQNGGFESAYDNWILDPSSGSASVTNALTNEGALAGLLFAGGSSGTPAVTLTQSLELPVAASIGLKVYLAMFQLGPDTTGTFSVKVDGTTVASVAQEDVAAFAFELLTANLSAYADGGTHTLVLEFAVSAGPGASSSIAVDAVTVVACEPVVEGEGEGVVEGVSEGEGEGVVDGEGVTEGGGEGTVDGEGVTEGGGEGTVDGEGVTEGGGEGTVDVEGEGAVEGEGEGVAEGEGEGVTEGEGEPANALEQLLNSFADADSDDDNLLTLAEAQAQVPGTTEQDLDEADANGDGKLSVAELLQRYGGGILNHADTNGDSIVQLTELLRLIQLFNAGAYACAENAGATEDGFALTAPPSEPACVLHSLDQNGDRVISLSELLRGIQLYNLGGYTWCPGRGTEDGFCG